METINSIEDFLDEEILFTAIDKQLSTNNREIMEQYGEELGRLYVINMTEGYAQGCKPKDKRDVKEMRVHVPIRFQEHFDHDSEIMQNTLHLMLLGFHVGNVAYDWVEKNEEKIDMVSIIKLHEQVCSLFTIYFLGEFGQRKYIKGIY